MPFFSIQIDKGTPWNVFHRTLEELEEEFELPSSVDLRPNFDDAGIEVYNQGELNSCTANAICSIWRYAQAKIDPGFQPSRLFLYYNERSAEGTISQDSGANISDGCRSLATYGMCSEDVWPYNEYDEPDEPPREAYDEAQDHIVHTPAQISNRDILALKDSLAQDKPFVVGIALYSEFMSDYTRETGIVPMPGRGSELHGYHAVTCVGYDDTNQWWIFRNSWGPDWGDQGHFYLPYEYLDDDENLSSDFWNITSDYRES